MEPEQIRCFGVHKRKKMPPDPPPKTQTQTRQQSWRAGRRDTIRWRNPTKTMIIINVYQPGKDSPFFFFTRGYASGISYEF